jgi:hypothetical protein
VKIAILGYFAATPATVQAGARVGAEAKLGPVEIKGHFYFDTIFYFEPRFHFEIDFGCGLAVRFKGHSLTSVDFDGTFTGPGRWRIKGKGEFKVLLWTVPINVDEAWGDAPPKPVVAGTDVKALLEKDVANKDLWSAQQPAGGAALVTLHAGAKGNTALAHPLSRLSFSQRRVPLQLQMQRFGRTPIIGASKIDVTDVLIGNKSVGKPSLVSEYFARSSFIEMSREAQLSKPSFELFPAGVEVGSTNYSVGPNLAVPLEYETAYIDPDQPEAEPKRDSIKFGLQFTHLVRQAAQSDVAQSRLRIQEKLRPAGVATKIKVTEAPLATATTDSMMAAAVALTGAQAYSPTLADQAVAKSNAMVVEAFEMATT